MHFQFTYTPDDLTEALAPELPPGQLPVKPSYAKGIFGWFLFLGLCVMLAILTMNQPASSAPQPPPQDMVVTLLPGTIVALFAATLYVFVRRASGRRRHPWKPPVAPDPAKKKNLDPVQTACVVGGVAILGVYMFAVRQYHLDPFRPLVWHPTRAQQFWLAFAPYALFLLPLYIAIARIVRRKPATLYGQHSFWQSPKTVGYDDDAVTISDDLTSSRRRWPNIARLRETPTLFLLVTIDDELVILPKGAFPTPADADSFRALLQSVLRPPDAPKAFPVLTR